MRSLMLCLTTAVLAACSATAPPAAAPTAEAHRVKAHVDFLAHDLLQGREATSKGYAVAAHYVASQMAAIGLSPAGDSGDWLQEVPLLRAERLREGASMRLLRGDETLSFEFESDYLPGVNYHRESWQVRAPLVFVGQAVVAAEFDHDDLAGVDVRGKIAVLFSGAPARFPNDQRAYYSSSRVKQDLLVERGAVGIVWLGDPEREGKYPWARGAKNWGRPSMRLRDQNGPLDTHPELLGTASINVEAARRLFAGAPVEAEQLFQDLESGRLKAFDLGTELELRGSNRLSAERCWNVVGQLPGNDPLKATEHVVYSAHLDHLGLGAPVNGDAIYNGALDNALGVALLLETARLAKAAPAVARSQLFVAVTAEEKGLLGSDYFAGHPSVPGELIANINMDMPVVLGPVRDALPIGIEHSDLESVVRDQASALGLQLSADPFPEEVVFIRSDQFSFIRRGIPAVYIDGGVISAGPGFDAKQSLTDFLRTHYHQPSDQADLPIHYPSAARIADLNAAVGAKVADQAARPRWNAGDFFASKFAPKQDAAVGEH
ncbi:M28 family metallopeptidase [Pseudomarimonas arenosa]|uniref:M28 family peptidase n=1 Tax=Pseudomarimonas arenosa TaxID=2774145 RepID=A0AAW3ZS31_9GAMM|nr:M28 family metallopeptidase [Pseudomarimonas arenosa]MBD8527907.1 M28 family peptidase [Pseudomarimonas arenosa]